MSWGRKQHDEPAESLVEPGKIDVVTLSPDQSTVELHVVVDAAWTGSDAQIRSLQDKIHAYVGYAVDGQLARMYPEVASLPWRVVVSCQSGPPDPRTAEVLARTAEPVRRYGGDLQVRT